MSGCDSTLEKTGTLEAYIRLCADIGPTYIQGAAVAAALTNVGLKTIKRKQRLVLNAERQVLLLENVDLLILTLVLPSLLKNLQMVRKSLVYALNAIGENIGHKIVAQWPTRMGHHCRETPPGAFPGPNKQQGQCLCILLELSIRH